MTAGLSVRPTPAACRISTASPILLHPSLITVFRVVPTLVSHESTNTGEPWEQFSVDQSIKSGRNGSGTKHLIFIAGHPSKYWPRSLALNQSTVPVLQPPLHLSSLCLSRMPCPLKTAKICLSRMPCPLCNVYSSGWIHSILGTNDPSMRGCVIFNNRWPWLISIRSFWHDFAIKLLKYVTSCCVHSTAHTVLDGFFSIFGTNDHKHKRVCHAPWPLILTNIFKVI